MCSEKRIVVGCFAERLFWTFVWRIAENLFKQSLVKEEQCALCGNLSELLQWFIFVNKAIYSQLQDDLLIIQRGEKTELITEQYRINEQRGKDLNTLKCRNISQRNFRGIRFCDFRPWSQKCFPKWRKSYFSSKNPIILKENIQKCETIHKTCSAKLIFWST